VAARLQRLQNNYEDYGMRRTVEGVLVVHVRLKTASHLWTESDRRLQRHSGPRTPSHPHAPDR
jgi:hypothetical protein